MIVQLSPSTGCAPGRGLNVTLLDGQGPLPPQHARQAMHHIPPSPAQGAVYCQAGRNHIATALCTRDQISNQLHRWSKHPQDGIAYCCATAGHADGSAACQQPTQPRLLFSFSQSTTLPLCMHRLGWSGIYLQKVAGDLSLFLYSGSFVCADWHSGAPAIPRDFWLANLQACSQHVFNRRAQAI